MIKIGELLILVAIMLPLGAALSVIPAARRDVRTRDYLVLAVVALTFAFTLLIAFRQQGGELRIGSSAVLALHFSASGFQALFAAVCALLWFITTLYSFEYFKGKGKLNRYWLLNLISLGATLGVFYSADFRTTIIFYEIMSFASYGMVAHEESSHALRAASTYLALAVISGLALLLGMLLLHIQTGTLAFGELHEITSGLSDRTMLYLPGVLLLIGFGIKAGVYPLHFWLPKAHPVAPAPASALLSGILTKTGIFGIIIVCTNLFPGDPIWGFFLLLPAAIGMIWGAILAICAEDIKTTLACSSVSQLSFILCGIALISLQGDFSVAASGIVLQMLNHSLLKLILFLAAGIIYINCHSLNYSDISGFGRDKPLFSFIFICGALGLAAIPFFSGYISKTLLLSALTSLFCVL